METVDLMFSGKGLLVGSCSLTLYSLLVKVAEEVQIDVVVYWPGC